jgi:hypothetical protein
MSAPQQLPFALGAAPSGFKAAAPSALSAPGSSTLLPAGAAYAAHLRRSLNQLSFAADDEAEHARLDAEAALGDDEEIVDDIGDEQESAQLLKSDPKEWKVRGANGEQRAKCGHGRRRSVWKARRRSSCVWGKEIDCSQRGRIASSVVMCQPASPCCKLVAQPGRAANGVA